MGDSSSLSLIGKFYWHVDFTQKYSIYTARTQIYVNINRRARPHNQIFNVHLKSLQSHRQSRPSDVFSTSHGGGTHQRFYLFISSQCRCRCFCWYANDLVYLATQTEEAQHLHKVKLSSFINASMLFQFPPVKRLYRNNYWGK